MNPNQIAAEAAMPVFGWSDEETRRKRIQAAIEKATEATAEEFRQGLYGKLDQAIKLVRAAHAIEQGADASKNPAYKLAMLVLQSDFYRSNPDVKDATDDVIDLYKRPTPATEGK